MKYKYSQSPANIIKGIKIYMGNIKSVIINNLKYVKRKYITMGMFISYNNIKQIYNNNIMTKNAFCRVCNK